MIYHFILFSFFISSPFFTTHTGVGDIEVSLANLENEEGAVCIILFANEEGYPEEPHKGELFRVFSIEKRPGKYVLEDVPFGDYVLTLFHDENENRILDKNFLGIPKEGYGISRNPAPGTFGPPQFKSGSFAHRSDRTKLDIKLLY